MKKRFIIWFILGILISFAVGYILGNNQNTLTISELDCLIEGSIDENIILTKNQAMCLANKGEVTSFYGIGNPFYAPDEFVRLRLESKKMILIKDNSSEFQNELESLGIRRISK